MQEFFPILYRDVVDINSSPFSMRKELTRPAHSKQKEIYEMSKSHVTVGRKVQVTSFHGLKMLIISVPILDALINKQPVVLQKKLWGFESLSSLQEDYTFL